MKIKTLINELSWFGVAATQPWWILVNIEFWE